jgi:Leucine-rich repeat (LRR) protein
LFNLEKLDLSYNALEDLPDNFGELQALQVLDLSGNAKLSMLPESFAWFT